MAADLEVDQATGVVIVTIEGKLDFGDVRDALIAVWQTPEFHDRGRVLWDLRRADAAGLDAGELRRIALFESNERPAMPPARLAFLVERDMEFGLARMVGVFSEDDAIEQQVFRDRDAAWSWLGA